jgi:hypothetical protein
MRKQTSAPAGRLSHWIALSFVLSSSFVGVAYANTAPTISGTPPKTINVDSYYNFRPTASDRESDSSSLRFAIANKPSWATFSVYSGQLHGVPKQAGTWSNIKISVTDGKATTALPVFSIKAVSTTTTTPANRAPVISGTPSGSVGVGSAYSFRPTASDPDGDKLSFSIQNRPGWATFSTSTGQLSGTPGTSNVGTFSNIVISVSDGKITAKLPAFSIAVVGQSSGAPTISGTPPTSVNVNSYYNFRPTASDPDSDTLRFSIVNQPSWASFSIYSGQLHGVPPQAGTWSNIKISVTDGKSTATLPAFSITAGSVTPTANRAPTISGSPATSAGVGSAYSFSPSASDPDGDTLGFSIQNRPAWATFSTSTGQLSGTPGASHVGTFSNIVISVSDGKITTKLPAFSITVSQSNAAPTISGTPATSVVAGKAYDFVPKASDSNGDALAFSIQNKPTWAVFDTKTGRLSGTPSASHVGTYSNIVIAVSDGKASKSLPAFAITVSKAPATSAPGTAVLTWTPPTTRANNTTLSNLAGYRIAYGTSATVLHESINVANPGLSSYVVENLKPGTYYFVVRAYDSTGHESDLSNVISVAVK